MLALGQVSAFTTNNLESQEWRDRDEAQVRGEKYAASREAGCWRGREARLQSRKRGPGFVSVPGAPPHSILELADALGRSKEATGSDGSVVANKRITKSVEI